VTEPDRRLWPESAESPTSSRFLVLGESDKGRMLIPTRPRAATGEALVRFHGGMGLSNRIARRAGAILGRFGLLETVVRNRRFVDIGDVADPNSLHHLLSSATGEKEIAIAVSFGPTRANQKPVIRVMQPGGATVAFAKIGWSALTGRLIQQEVAALQTPGIGHLQHVTAPPVLFAGEWQTFQVAVFGALLGKPGRTTPSEDAFNEVGGIWGVSESTLGESEFARQLIRSADHVEGLVGEQASMSIEKLLALYGGDSFNFAGWHGDWTPWNNARLDDSRIALWDWERAGDAAPLGFDSIHYRFQPAFLRSRLALGDLLELASSGLENQPALERLKLARIYAATIALRHLQPDSGAGPYQKSANLIKGLGDLLAM
jgi:hypothetical protein